MRGCPQKASPRFGGLGFSCFWATALCCSTQQGVLTYGMTTRPSLLTRWKQLGPFNFRLIDRARDACRDHDTDALRACLDDGLDLEVLVQGSPSSKPVPLLVFATDLLFVDGVHLLLERGASPDVQPLGFGGKPLKNTHGNTSLFRLTSKDVESDEGKQVLACAKALVLAGASVDGLNWGLDRETLLNVNHSGLGIEYKWISVREQQAHMTGSMRQAWESLVELADAMKRSQALEQHLQESELPKASPPKPRF